MTAPEEFEVLKKISERDQTIIEAKEEHAPHLICRYLLDLSKVANSYYANVKIRSSEEPIKTARLLLLEKIITTLKKGMQTIGMEFIERM